MLTANNQKWKQGDPTDDAQRDRQDCLSIYIQVLLLTEVKNYLHQ